MDVNLSSVFSLKVGQSDELESFIGHRLFEAGVWKSSRTSDGIQHLRVVECKPESLRVCGRIFEIDQTLHSFWLDLQPASEGSVAWTLHFGIIGGSSSHQRNAVDAYDHADKIEWRITLKGKAKAREDVLVVTSEASTH